MSNATSVKLTRTNKKIGSVRVTFEISFPNKQCEERDRAFEMIGRLMREALPTPEQREEFLANLERAKQEAFAK